MMLMKARELISTSAIADLAARFVQLDKQLIVDSKADTKSQP